MASDASLQKMIQHARQRQRQLAALAEPTASKLADVLVAELELRTPGPGKNPLNTGNLKRALTKKTAPYKFGAFWMVGVGDLDLLGGKPPSAAPGGTIAEFLADHREAYEEELIERGTAAYEEAEARRQAAIEQRKAAADARRRKTLARHREIMSRRMKKLNRRIDALEGAEARLLDRIFTYDRQRNNRVNKKGENIFDPANKKGDWLLVDRRSRAMRRLGEIRYELRQLRKRKTTLINQYVAWWRPRSGRQ